MFIPGTVLLHDNLASQGQNLLFTAPREVLVAHDAAGARAALARLAEAGRRGLWAAGYLAYDLGLLFEERLERLLPRRSRTPLLWFGLYDAPQRPDGEAIARLLAAAQPGRATELAPILDFATYRQAFERVQALIAAGDVYQVNLTLKARFRLDGDPLGLYSILAESQPVAYGAYINAGDHQVLSRSPELFVAVHGDRVKARPMKGTLRRGHTVAEDAAGRAALAADPKNRAENLMIVDLLRNDLGRIAEIGSVQVTDLFTVETYRSLHTMTSGIKARKKPAIGLGEVLENLFPCGSVTGAPKLRAMEIIHAVEAMPRGLYTGSIGYIAPNGDFAFNVAIRTALIHADGTGEIGIGGGIVADSTAEDEYQEALLKLKFLSDPAPPVVLIETFKWTPGEGYALLDRHLDRLLASAAYFALPVTRGEAAAYLAASAGDWAGPMRVRLTLSASGLDLTATPLPPSPEKFRFAIAEERLDSTSLWLAHKTTNRAFYDQPRQRAHERLGLDEVVFRNERDELTEGSFTNLFIERGGRLFTPPLASGLLPGTLRADLIARGKAEERRLTLADLDAAEAIWLGNSVRGLVPAEWIKD
ncbi:aminodeoxychorismate synthase component I [Devosia sp. YIM 151766]|uniref:aminodeoxychorismate synthase component I n=1 Tax=Devosia sp. YIM 151766 TaxID=3017325 RepID=UPI00255C539D|nr:aminodeoxychorismate synthase component I [Devosia sp. YIM 151766]WIY52862.1 aminodeoxychorismate synthase component I [Devosia sp. YIM 151766]